MTYEQYQTTAAQLEANGYTPAPVTLTAPYRAPRRSVDADRILKALEDGMTAGITGSGGDLCMLGVDAFILDALPDHPLLQGPACVDEDADGAFGYTFLFRGDAGACVALDELEASPAVLDQCVEISAMADERAALDDLIKAAKKNNTAVDPAVLEQKAALSAQMREQSEAARKAYVSFYRDRVAIEARTTLALPVAGVRWINGSPLDVPAVDLPWITGDGVANLIAATQTVTGLKRVGRPEYSGAVDWALGVAETVRAA